jgi:hypothetical protein
MFFVIGEIKMNNPIFQSLLYIAAIVGSALLAYNSLKRPIEKWAKKAFVVLPIFAVLWSGAGFLLIMYEPILKCNQRLMLTQIKSLSAGIIITTMILLFMSGQMKNPKSEQNN